MGVGVEKNFRVRNPSTQPPPNTGKEKRVFLCTLVDGTRRRGHTARFWLDVVGVGNVNMSWYSIYSNVPWAQDETLS